MPYRHFEDTARPRGTSSEVGGNLPGAGLEPARPCGRGIFVLATAFTAESCDSFGVWTFSLPWFSAEEALKVRQGPSSLYTFPRACQVGSVEPGSEGLARDCRHRVSAVGLVPRI